MNAVIHFIFFTVALKNQRNLKKLDSLEQFV
jgi:hypothetical protein